MSQFSSGSAIESRNSSDENDGTPNEPSDNVIQISDDIGYQSSEASQKTSAGNSNDPETGSLIFPIDVTGNQDEFPDTGTTKGCQTFHSTSSIDFLELPTNSTYDFFGSFYESLNEHNYMTVPPPLRDDLIFYDTDRAKACQTYYSHTPTSTRSPVQLLNIPSSSSSDYGNRSPYEASEEGIPVKYFKVGDFAYLIKNSKATQTKFVETPDDPESGILVAPAQDGDNAGVFPDTANTKATQTVNKPASHTVNPSGEHERFFSSGEGTSSNQTFNTELNTGAVVENVPLGPANRGCAFREIGRNAIRRFRSLRTIIAFMGGIIVLMAIVIYKLSRH